MFRNVVTKVLGDPNKKTINSLTPLVEDVNRLEPEMERKSDEELRDMIARFRADIAEETAVLRGELDDHRTERDAAGGDARRRLEIEVERLEKDLLKLETRLMEEIMPHVFAAVREASVRTTGLRHYDVQVVGGAVLHAPG
jgi:preprotein translocase subunit SecA